MDLTSHEQWTSEEEEEGGANIDYREKKESTNCTSHV